MPSSINYRKYVPVCISLNNLPIAVLAVNVGQTTLWSDSYDQVLPDVIAFTTFKCFPPKLHVSANEYRSTVCGLYLALEGL